ncbi:MAG: N-acetyltransferase family protein [Alphaproteobacteria bacterium]
MKIRPATPNDIDAVCALLHAGMNSKIALDRWRRLMTYPWLADKPDLGRVVDDNGTIRGYVGMVYADRDLVDRGRGDTAERVVNICAWYLAKEARGGGLGHALMADATSDPGMSYDIMTSSAKTVSILAKLGYRVLDDTKYVWSRGADGTPHAAGALQLEADRVRILPSVSSAERKILEDMAPYNVLPILAAADRERHLILFTVARKGADVVWYDVLYAGDAHFLGRHAQALAAKLLPDARAQLAADARFVIDPVGGRAEKLPVPRFYKTSRLQAGDVDHLYSELQLLNLKLD